MLTAVIGVPSASKACTYHENKDSFKRKDLTFLSKGELRRAYEFIELENFHLKQGKNIEDYQKKYREKLDEVMELQEKVLALQEEIRQKNKKETPINYLRLAV